MEDDDSAQRSDEDDDRDDVDEGRRKQEGDGRTEIPRLEPEPGVTAPVTELTEEEKELEPVPMMPGATADEDADETAGPEETREAGHGEAGVEAGSENREEEAERREPYTETEGLDDDGGGGGGVDGGDDTGPRDEPSGADRGA